MEAAMSSIVFQHDKRSGITYAYESTSYYDKEKKQPRAKRKLIGRVDPVSGQIVPTGGRKGRPVSSDSSAALNEKYDQLKKECADKDNQLAALNSEIFSLRKEIRQLKELLSRINSISNLGN